MSGIPYQQEEELRLVLSRLESDAVVCLIVFGKQVELRSAGIDNREALFDVLFSAALDVAEDVIGNMSPDKRDKVNQQIEAIRRRNGRD